MRNFHWLVGGGLLVAFLVRTTASAGEEERSATQHGGCNAYDFCVFDGFARLSAGASYQFLRKKELYTTSEGQKKSHIESFDGFGGQFAAAAARIFDSGFALGGFAQFDFGPNLKFRETTSKDLGHSDAMSTMFLHFGPHLAFYPAFLPGLFFDIRPAIGWIRSKEIVTSDNFTWGGNAGIGFEHEIIYGLHLGGSARFTASWAKDGEFGDSGDYEYWFTILVPSVVLHGIF